METLYIYKINTPTGLVVKIGCTIYDAYNRMLDYEKNHGLSIDTDSLHTLSVKDGKSAEVEMHQIFLDSGYRHVTGRRFNPAELFQSEFIRTYDDAVRLFNLDQHEDTKGLKLDNVKRWKTDELVTSYIAERPLKIASEHCGLVKIVLPHKDEIIFPNARYTTMQKSLKKPNREVMRLLTFKDIAEENNLVLTDSLGKPFDFKPALQFEENFLKKTSGSALQWPTWRKDELNAARDFFKNDGFDNINKSTAHQHVFFGAKVLLQEGFSLQAV